MGFYCCTGVYLDAVAFDRTTMERIRKNMERLKDNVRVDIHRSGGWFCHGPGYGTPALRYMQVCCGASCLCNHILSRFYVWCGCLQHFAWADSLWFGEVSRLARACRVRSISAVHRFCEACASASDMVDGLVSSNLAAVPKYDFCGA